MPQSILTPCLEKTMPVRVVVDRTVTSGNIRDPALEEQKIIDIEARRTAMWSVTLALVGGVAFIVVGILYSLLQ